MDRMDYKKLENRLKDYKSLAFWSWNGKMQESEIRRQIDEMADQGYGGFFIHSRAGLEIPYMGSEWFAACETAVSHAEKRSLSVWIYDEDGWPSGFAGGIVPLAGLSYQFKRMLFLTDPEKLRQIPEERRIAAYRRTTGGNGSDKRYERLPRPEEFPHADLAVYFETDPHYVDLLNPEVTHLFLQSTHEVYKKHLGRHFGKTIQGCFADEPQLNNAGYSWSFSLEEIYRQRTDRELLDELWMLDVGSEEGRRFRQDYWKMIHDRFKESFTDPIADWCAKNGLEFTGHFAAEDGLCDQISSNGGVMSMYSAMQLPGIDHLGRRLASPVLMKQVSSVAEQYGKPRVLSESFGCSGWGITFEEMAWIWGHQAVLGINLPCLHLTAYTIKGVRKRDYPAFFSEQETWWNRFGILNRWMAALNTIMAGGRSDANVLVLVPLSGMWTETVRPGYSLMEKVLSAQFRELVENLLKCQVAFDLGDEALFEKDARAEDGRIVLGQSSYSMVFLAETTTAGIRTAGILESFVEGGGELVFINIPPSRVEASPDQRFFHPPFDRCSTVQNRRDMLRKYLDIIGFKRSIVFSDKRSSKPSKDIYVRVREYDDRIAVYVWNSRTDSPNQLKARIEGAWIPEKLDLCSSACFQGSPISFRTGENDTWFEIDIPPRGSEAIVLKKMQETERSDQPVPATDSGEGAFASRPLRITSAGRTDFNALTIDKASCRFNGQPAFKTMNVLHLQDQVYKRVSQEDRECFLTFVYRFHADISDPGTLNGLVLAAEATYYSEIRINGCKVEAADPEFWIDRSILKIPIGHWCRCGENTVEMDCVIPKWQPITDLEAVFETERNRFHYPVGIEAVYILGDFQVGIHGRIDETPAFYRVKEAEFTLEEPGVLNGERELTAQGLWFYRGNIEMEAELDLSPEEQQDEWVIQAAWEGFILAELFINGHAVKNLVLPPYTCEITPWLKQGSNKIKLVLYGSNRNLLGPHHHIKGELDFVGPNIFLGKKGYEDFVSPEILQESTWTEDYSFVRTGLDGPVCLLHRPCKGK